MTTCTESTFKNKLFVIVGPTAGKKSSLAYALNQKFDLDIVNSDIYKAYKDADCWVNQIDPKNLSSGKYHLYCMLDPKEPMNIFLYQEIARKKITELLKRGSVVVVGGSCLYCNAILFNEYVGNTKEKKAKPERFTNFFENTIFIELEWEREELYELINQRAKRMLEKGLETPKRILDEYPNSLLSRAIGYKEWAKYFENEASIEEVVELIRKHTRNFAKRQLTWYRNQYTDLNTFKITLETLEKTFQEIEAFVGRKIGE